MHGLVARCNDFAGEMEDMMSNEIKFRECPGCLSRYSPDDCPVDRTTVDKYGVMSPECVKAYADVLAYEYRRYRHSPVHQLLIDGVALQHPPHLDVQVILGIDRYLVAASVQILPMHLMSLYLAFERRLDPQRVEKEMKFVRENVIKNKIEFLELSAPKKFNCLRMIDLLEGVNSRKLLLDEFSGFIYKFADATWYAWSDHHLTIKHWFNKYKQV